jgi:N utilization substance protein B
MTTTVKRNFIRGRSWARRFAMQALYQWQMTGQDLSLIDAQFAADQDMEKADIDYFRELFHQSLAQTQTLNAAISPYLDRPLEQIDPVEKAILWVSCYELAFRPDIPYRVVINEGVELAKKFGAEQGHRFINGILDKAAHQLRSDEVALRIRT